MASCITLAGADANSYALETLDRLETQFLSSLHDAEGQLLALFHSSWSQFQDELDSLEPHLAIQTREKIDKFVSIMVTVSTSLVEASSSDIVDELKTNLLDVMTPATQSHVSVPPSGRYIEDSIRWIRANLHNPYPSKAIRSMIARRTNSLLKDVDAWFVDFRKRIGWSSLRCSRFGNRKSDIVDAATRFYTGSDPYRPLQSIVESEFASIAATVEQLYSEKCVGSTLASHLDQAVQDLTPELQQSLSKERRRARSTAHRSRSPRHHVHPYPYPSPELSPTLSSRTLCTPEPSVLDLPSPRLFRHDHSSDEEEATTSMKRKRMSTAEEESSAKRRKCSGSPGPSNVHSQLSCYPSPAASVVTKQPELPAEQPFTCEVVPTSSDKSQRTLSDVGTPLPSPPRDSASQPSTPPNPPLLTVDEILDQGVFPSAAVASPSASSIVQSSVFNPYNAFASLFAAFTGTGTDALNAATQPLNQLPLLNIVDDVPPANVHVEYDQSWSVGYCADELAPSMDTSITGYNFDDFGSSLYTDSTNLLGGQNQQWGSFWLADPSQDSLAIDGTLRSNTASLPLAAQPSPPAPGSISDSSTQASHLHLPTPSQTSGFHCLDIPLEGMRLPLSFSGSQAPGSSDPLAHLTDKAKELMELEARCAALRSELVSVC